MDNKTLSVCMIVKNEEANIGRCLASVVSIADEIIVVDTGSTDRTKEIAKEYGAVVLDHPWDHDFSAARNKSLDYATKDWVLVLDADEELEPEEAIKMKNVINLDTPSKAFYLRLVNIINSIDIGNAIVLRLFENGPTHRFKGRLHEQIINKLQELYGNDCIGQTPIRILHYGYDPNVSNAKQKSQRNLDILLNYEEKDKDGYYYYVLGNEYARVDDFDEALRIYRKALSVTDYKRFTYIYYPYLIMNIAKVLSNAGRFSEEIREIREFTKITPYFKDLYFMQALALIECSKMTEAKEALDKYLNCPAGQYEYPCSNFEVTYNVPDLMSQLIKGSIRKNKKLMDVYVFVDDQVSKAVDAIKSVTEIANDVIAVVAKGNTENLNVLLNLGAKLDYTDVDMEDYKFKASSVQYRLCMKANELCSFISQQQFVEELEELDGDTFALEIIDLDTGISHFEFRLARNKKKYYSLRKYQEAIDKGEMELEETFISIHEKKNINRGEVH